jgi:putative tricarboxylic transport membrane protein
LSSNENQRLSSESEIGEAKKGVGWGDYIVPVVVFVFCAVVIAIAMTLEEAIPLIVGHSMQPRVFPIFLMAVIAVLNVALIFQIVRSPVSRRDWEPIQTWTSAGLLLLFFLLAKYIDTLVALVIVMFMMSIVWGERRIWVAAILALGTTAFIFFSFDQILQVRFPRGLLTDAYYG